MIRPAQLQFVVRTLLLALMACSAGCSAFTPTGTGPPPPPPEAEPSASSETAAPTAAAADEAAPAKLPVPAPAVNPMPQPARAPRRERVALVTSSDAASFREVADALGERLAGRYDIAHLPLAGDDPGHALAAIEPAGLSAAIAIGADAAAFAGRTLPVPMIFCQVFNYEPLLALPTRVYGVAALPPLHLQLRSWKAVAPGLSSVGVIVSERHAGLVEEARHAAHAAGIELHAQFAASDREVMYRFQRMVPAVDGFWLFPDNEILSPRVMREMLDYAQKHDVHSLVFNASLLEWGALLSVGSRPGDVADTVARVLDAVTGADTEGTANAGTTATASAKESTSVGTSSTGIPAITPLSDIDVQVAF